MLAAPMAASWAARWWCWVCVVGVMDRFLLWPLTSPESWTGCQALSDGEITGVCWRWGDSGERPRGVWLLLLLWVEGVGAELL